MGEHQLPLPPPPRESTRLQRPSERIKERKGYYQCLLLLLVPLVVPCLVVWWLLGFFLTLPSVVVALVCAAMPWILFLSMQSVAWCPIDFPIVVMVLSVAIVLVANTSKSLSGLLMAACWLYGLLRNVLMTSKPSHAALIDALTVCAFVLPSWALVCTQHLWISATEQQLEQAERAIYSQSVRGDFTMTKVAGLGTVHAPFAGDKRGPSEPVPRTLVLIHGYMAGNALWALSLDYLAKSFDVYAVEWKGTGRSVRPRFAPKSHQEEDDFFIESLEEWRKELQLDRILLCGHSMGGTYATYYATRYPHHVEHLLLVSPAAVAEYPHRVDDLPVFWKVMAAWSITPASLIRFAGPFGMRLVRWGVRMRLTWVPKSNVLLTGEMAFESMIKYCYHNWALPASGEKSLYMHLLPGGSGPRPLCHLLVPEKFRVPVTFLYGGEFDWMNPEHAKPVVQSLQKTHYAVLQLVPSAGHQVFLDNPKEFQRLLVEAVHHYDNVAQPFRGE